MTAFAFTRRKRRCTRQLHHPVQAQNLLRPWQITRIAVFQHAITFRLPGPVRNSMRFSRAKCSAFSYRALKLHTPDICHKPTRTSKRKKNSLRSSRQRSVNLTPVQWRARSCRLVEVMALRPCHWPIPCSPLVLALVSGQASRRRRGMRCRCRKRCRRSKKPHTMHSAPLGPVRQPAAPDSIAPGLVQKCCEKGDSPPNVEKCSHGRRTSLRRDTKRTKKSS